jgi:transposase
VQLRGLEEKLARAQRKMSNEKKSSNNWKKARVEAQRIHRLCSAAFNVATRTTLIW